MKTKLQDKNNTNKRKSLLETKRSITHYDFDELRKQIQEEQKEKVIEELPAKIIESEDYEPVTTKEVETNAEVPLKTENNHKPSSDMNINKKEESKEPPDLSKSLLLRIKARSNAPVERYQPIFIKKQYTWGKKHKYDQYEFQDKINYNYIGVVNTIREIETNKIYVAKTVRNFYDELDIDYLEYSTVIISYMDHPLITKCYGYFENINISKTVIKEFVPNKSLYDLLKSFSPDEWTDTKKLMNIYGIAAALSYLHSQNIVHCNLKAENILLDENYLPKITDISFSKPPIVDILYIAPEVIQYDRYSKSSDVYAFAFIMYEILVSENIEINMNKVDFFKKVIDENYRPNIPDFIPLVYKKLIEQCLSRFPNERPTFDEILNELKNNDHFITDTINTGEYYDYIDRVDQCQRNSERNNFQAEKEIIWNRLWIVSTEYYDLNMI